MGGTHGPGPGDFGALAWVTALGAVPGRWPQSIMMITRIIWPLLPRVRVSLSLELEI